MNMRTWVSFPALLISLFVLAGCATQKALVPSPVESAPAALLFHNQVAALPEGSTQYFAESPFGPATVEAGPLYFSGMGNECRSARVAAGNASHRFAVCREENGTWSFIPSVFESMPR